ncbi:VMAP-C domain-containing protein [Streptomyces goshikiensis]|uniref:VMAP-C domain-containing protein n=1 Tax=Streptomyces goshikiensis TaxID=1942 RepID=UPI00379D3500
MSVPRLPPKKVHLRLVLVEELSALDCLRDPGQRVLFGHSVGEYLERPVDMPGKDARNDTVALVHAVLREQHEVETALDALLYAVGLHEGSDTAGRVRERVLSAWAPEVSPLLPLHGAFEDEDAGAARALLAGQSGIDRGRLLDRLAYELRLELPRELTPAQLFDHLLDMNAQADGLPPAVVMLESVAALAPRESDRHRLRDWCDAWAASAGARDALARRRAQIQAAAPPDRDMPRCLIVMVDPAVDGSPDIFVRHWVNRSAGYWAPVSGSLERATLETLGAAVERAIRRGEESWAEADGSGEDTSPIHVEFVLPYSMLNHDVAGIGRSADDSGDPVPIGLRYYVHLRSLERMRTRDPAQLRRWRLRWQTLRSAAAARPHSWTGSDPATGLRIWRNQLVADQQLTAVTLAAPALEGQALEPLKAAIAEGIGVALWDRREPSHEQLGVPLNMLIGYPTAQLPVTIHRLRMRAEVEAGGFQLPGRHVAFFYDDPFRLIDCEEVPA